VLATARIVTNLHNQKKNVGNSKLHSWD